MRPRRVEINPIVFRWLRTSSGWSIDVVAKWLKTSTELYEMPKPALRVKLK